MPTRVQALALGLGIKKQATISTLAGSPTWTRMRKLDGAIYTNDHRTETDATEIGKGNEFISGVYPVQKEFGGEIQKYGSAEFVLWSWAYALGNVGYGSSLYTIVPIDPGTTIELPYFPMVQQLNEAGQSAIDELNYGNIISDVVTNFESGTGRRSVTTTARFAGSGKSLRPSGITLPSTVETENYMLSASMAATINGTDYVAGKGLVRGTMGWNNNPLLDAGFFPGSGTEDGAAIRGRIEIGVRVPTFAFTVRLKYNSPEFAALIAQTSGTAVITLTYDATHYVTWTWQKMSYQSVVKGDSDGIVTVNVVGAPQWHSTNGILTVTGKCGLADIAG